MNIENINIEISYFNVFKRERQTILFLHGFTGSTEDWIEISKELQVTNYNLIGIDLPGHGKSSSPQSIEYYKLPFLIKVLRTIVISLQLDKIVLIGYSMGGRLALAFAAYYPQNISKLILESTSPGLTNLSERAQRIDSDYQVIKILEEKGIDEFVDYWMNLPLFLSQNKYKDKLTSILNRKLNLNSTGIINSLKGFGTGVMPPQYENLKNITFPVLLLTGSLDSKFTNINKNITQYFKQAKHLIINNAGHNIHFEKPIEYANAIKDFLD